MDNLTSSIDYSKLTQLVKETANSSAESPVPINETLKALSGLASKQSSNVAMMLMKQLEMKNNGSEVSMENEMFPKATVDEDDSMAMFYLPFFPLEDVIEKTVEKYGIVNFLVLLMMGTLLFSLALVAFILAMATWLRCDDNDDDDDSCASSVLDEESVHYEDLDDDGEGSNCSDVDSPEHISTSKVEVNSKQSQYKHLEDYLALESCYDMCDPAYVALQTQNKPTKPKHLPRLLNYARTPGYFYHNLGKELMGKIVESTKGVEQNEDDGCININNFKQESNAVVAIEKIGEQTKDTAQIEMTLSM